MSAAATTAQSTNIYPDEHDLPIHSFEPHTKLSLYSQVSNSLPGLFKTAYRIDTLLIQALKLWTKVSVTPFFPSGLFVLIFAIIIITKNRLLALFHYLLKWANRALKESRPDELPQHAANMESRSL